MKKQFTFIKTSFIAFTLLFFMTHAEAEIKKITEKDFSIKKFKLATGSSAIIPVPNKWKILFNKQGQTIKLYSQNPQSMPA